MARRYYRRPGETEVAHAWSRIPAPARIVTSDELGSPKFPLRENLPPPPELAARRCRAFWAPLEIPGDAWPEFRWQDDDGSEH